MALDRVVITRTVDSGQTTVAVYYLTRRGQEGHVVVSRELVGTPKMYLILEEAARKRDAVARILKVADERQAEG